MVTDEELALKAQQGSLDSLEALVERYYASLFGYLYRLTVGNRMLSEDLVQETWLRAQRALRMYVYPRPFKTWIYAIATNLVRDHAARAETRRTQIQPDPNLIRDCADDTEPEHQALHQETVAQLKQALMILPQPQREVVVLYYYQELSQNESALALDIPLGTVKSRLSTGLHRLREFLEPNDA